MKTKSLLRRLVDWLNARDLPAPCEPPLTEWADRPVWHPDACA
jgi:hypothetical protein